MDTGFWLMKHTISVPIFKISVPIFTISVPIFTISVPIFTISAVHNTSALFVSAFFCTFAASFENDSEKKNK